MENIKQHAILHSYLKVWKNIKKVLKDENFNIVCKIYLLTDLFLFQENEIFINV